MLNARTCDNKGTYTICKEQPCCYIPDIDTDDLTEEQRLIVRKVLIEEAESFSKANDDVVGAEELQVDITITGSVPVQRKYSAIPGPKYGEVTQYVEDLLNLGWIQKSKSAYSSPIVCVRKNDGSLRLCTNYRQLNSKRFATAILCPGCRMPWKALVGISGSLYSTKERLTLKVL